MPIGISTSDSGANNGIVNSGDELKFNEVLDDVKLQNGDATGDNATGGDVAGDDATGDDVAGGDATGDDATGDNATGDNAVGDDVAGDDATGDNATGDNATGDDATGDDVAGDGTQNNDLTWANDRSLQGGLGDNFQGDIGQNEDNDSGQAVVNDDEPGNDIEIGDGVNVANNDGATNGLGSDDEIDAVDAGDVEPTGYSEGENGELLDENGEPVLGADNNPIMRNDDDEYVVNGEVISLSSSDNEQGAAALTRTLNFDGTLAEVRSDGSVLVKNADGSTTVIEGNVSTTYPQGFDVPPVVVRKKTRENGAAGDKVEGVDGEKRSLTTGQAADRLITEIPLIGNLKWQKGTVNFKLDENMTDFQKQQARKAFEEWNSLIALNIVEIEGGKADISFGYGALPDDVGGRATTNAEKVIKKGAKKGGFWGAVTGAVLGGIVGGPGGAVAGAVAGGTAGAGVGAKNSLKKISVNITINNNAQDDVLVEDGDFYYEVYLHEIGHALGLAHPGNYNAGEGKDINYEKNAEFKEDTKRYSTMSYFNPNADESDTDYNGLSASTPMLFDIAAIQKLYGKNTTTRNGNDVYEFKAESTKVAGSTRTDVDFDKLQEDDNKLYYEVWKAAGLSNGWEVPPSDYGSQEPTPIDKNSNISDEEQNLPSAIESLLELLKQKYPDASSSNNENSDSEMAAISEMATIDENSDAGSGNDDALPPWLPVIDIDEMENFDIPDPENMTDYERKIFIEKLKEMYPELVVVTETADHVRKRDASGNVRTLYDTGGIDTIDTTSFNSDGLRVDNIWDDPVGGTYEVRTIDTPPDQRIDLRAGKYSSIGYMKNNVAIAEGVVIENVNTGDTNDQIIGNDANNNIRSSGGNNVISTGGGNNLVSTGAGFDHITAGKGNDIIHSGAGNDMVYAGNGDDTIWDGAGDDEYHVGQTSTPGQNDRDSVIFTVKEGQNFGNDVIRGFDSRRDSINIRGMAEGAEVKVTRDGNDIVIDTGSGMIRIKDMSMLSHPSTFISGASVNLDGWEFLGVPSRPGKKPMPENGVIPRPNRPGLSA